jgi:hypothetical protein
MCCGSKRSVLRNTAIAIPARRPASPVFQSAASGAPQASLLVTLHYLQTAAIRVRGPVTGRHYEFSGARPAQAVDPGDAPGLARTGLFRRV